MTRTVFSAPDIQCGGCANAIRKCLDAVEGIRSVQVDIDRKTVMVDHDVELASVASVLTRLDHAGFPATVQSH